MGRIMSNEQNTPQDLVSPDEILDFLKERKVSPEAATGIRLLNRAATTIAYQRDMLGKQSDVIRARIAQLDDIALALGADFQEKFPDDYTVHDVLRYIEDLYVQMTGLQQGIIDRDQIIENFERKSPVPLEQPIPVSVVWDSYSDELKQHNSDQSEDKCDQTDSIGHSTLGVDQQWIDQTTKFLYKVYGIMLALGDNNPSLIRIQGEAEQLFDKSPLK